MEQKKVSIALCTYNGAKYIEEQLETVINQTYKNLEIIVIDDCSTDETVTIINKFAERDNRILLHQNKQNLGVIKNFEKAIYLCTGDFIALCDQDDVWLYDKIKFLVENIDDNSLIYHNSQLINDAGKHLFKISDIFNMYQGDNPLAFIFFNCIPGHTSMFNRELLTYLKLYGPFDDNFYHDWWIAFIAASYGKIKYLDKVLVNYRQHLNSLTDMSNGKEETLRIGTPKYGEINLAWLKKCYTVSQNSQVYIGNLIEVLKHRSPNYIPRLFYLLLIKSKYTYFMKKKAGISKVNYLRKASYFVMKH